MEEERNRGAAKLSSIFLVFLLAAITAVAALMPASAQRGLRERRPTWGMTSEDLQVVCGDALVKTDSDIIGIRREARYFLHPSPCEVISYFGRVLSVSTVASPALTRAMNEQRQAEQAKATEEIAEAATPVPKNGDWMFYRNRGNPLDQKPRRR